MQLILRKGLPPLKSLHSHSRMKHVTVLENELIDHVVTEAGIYVDVTLGAGGHMKGLLKRGEVRKAIGIDVSQDAIDSFDVENREERIELVLGNFGDIKEIAARSKVKEIAGIIADLGFSTDELTAVPGLSFRNEDDELDMRLGDTELKAKDWLNLVSVDQITSELTEKGDFGVNQSKRFGEQVKKSRKEEGIATVQDLNQIIGATLGTDSRTHQRVYQTIRIAINNEFENLQRLITDGFELLKLGGRMGIITFHSGEEGIVTDAFQSLIGLGLAKNIIRSIDGRYLRPSVTELRQNLAARSAKLHVIEKIDGET